jgi:hypothetical protein
MNLSGNGQIADLDSERARARRRQGRAELGMPIELLKQIAEQLEVEVD